MVRIFLKNVLMAVTLCLMATLFSCKSEIIDLPRADVNPVIEKQIDDFVAACDAARDSVDHITVHSVMLVQHGKVIAQRWLNGASEDQPHVMHSVSKTFTAIACGMAIEEGKLRLEDKVVDIFPEQLPDTLSENLKAMTVRDLLTMTCGQVREASAVREGDGDWVTGFLAADVEYEPGTYFAYNSLGTYMVSAMIQKVTGEKMNDYLNSRLYEPLHIEKPVWEESPQGINCGGWGLYIKTEDMAKVGQLLLDKGQWNGRQLISREWVEEMTEYQVSTKRPVDKRADWTQGYCYFMWCCTHNGVRADGSEGQYIIVLPDLDALIVLTSDSSLYQPYLDIVWEYLLPALEMEA